MPEFPVPAHAADSQPSAATGRLVHWRALLQDLPDTFGLTVEQVLEAFELAWSGQHRRGGSRPDPDLDALRGTASDIVLAAAYRTGTPQAVEAFRLRFLGMVRFVTRSCLTPGEAAEAEDEVWAALWEKLAQYEGRSSLSTWLYVVIRRWCWSRARKRPLPGPEWSPEEGVGAEDRVADEAPEVGAQITCKSFAAAIDRASIQALLVLSPQERALLRLRFVHHLPLETLRHRPEIYTPGEPPQPIYGITRRVQRAGKRIREQAIRLLAQVGYSADDCTRLLQECEQVEAELARRLAHEFAQDDLQIDEPTASNL